MSSSLNQQQILDHLREPIPKESLRNSKLNIYVDLDSIFDVRFAALCHMSQVKTYAMLEKDVYHRRISDCMDKLGDFDQAEFERIIKNRGEMLELRKYFAHTHTLSAVLSAEGLYYDVSIGDAVETEYNVVINIWPYVLSKREFEKLKAGFDDMFLRPVTFVNLPPEKLTPKFIMANYQNVFMYYFEDWLNLHVSALGAVPLFTVDFIIPYLAGKHPATAKEEALIRSEENIALARKQLSPLLSAVHVPSSNVSIMV